MSDLHQCQDCGATLQDSEVVPAKDLSLRVEPGEPMPSGECPFCGALCHIVNVKLPDKIIVDTEDDRYATFYIRDENREHVEVDEAYANRINASLQFINDMARFTTPEDEIKEDDCEFDNVDDLICEMGDDRLGGEYATFMGMVREARQILKGGAS